MPGDDATEGSRDRQPHVRLEVATDDLNRQWRELAPGSESVKTIVVSWVSGAPKSDAFTGTIILDEFYASGFKRSAQRSFVSGRYWDFPVNDLHPTNSCYADF